MCSEIGKANQYGYEEDSDGVTTESENSSPSPTRRAKAAHLVTELGVPTPLDPVACELRSKPVAGRLMDYGALPLGAPPNLRRSAMFIVYSSAFSTRSSCRTRFRFPIFCNVRSCSSGVNLFQFVIRLIVPDQNYY